MIPLIHRVAVSERDRVQRCLERTLRERELTAKAMQGLDNDALLFQSQLAELNAALGESSDEKQPEQGDRDSSGDGSSQDGDGKEARAQEENAPRVSHAAGCWCDACNNARIAAASARY